MKFFISRFFILLHGHNFRSLKVGFGKYDWIEKFCITVIVTVIV